MKRFEVEHLINGPRPGIGQHCVYALYCPVAKQFRYVGITGDKPARRLSNHLQLSPKDTSADKKAWIQALKDRGLPPFMRILKVVDTATEAMAWEACISMAWCKRRALCSRGPRLSLTGQYPALFAVAMKWLDHDAPKRTADWPALKADIRLQ